MCASVVAHTRLASIVYATANDAPSLLPCRLLESA